MGGPLFLASAASRRPRISGHGLHAVRRAENTLFAGGCPSWARALCLDPPPARGPPAARPHLPSCRMNGSPPLSSSSPGSGSWSGASRVP